jgi:hypothetical protein
MAGELGRGGLGIRLGVLAGGVHFCDMLDEFMDLAQYRGCVGRIPYGKRFPSALYVCREPANRSTPSWNRWSRGSKFRPSSTSSNSTPAS